jgi:hypothetical protein
VDGRERVVWTEATLGSAAWDGCGAEREGGCTRGEREKTHEVKVKTSKVDPKPIYTTLYANEVDLWLEPRG